MTFRLKTGPPNIHFQVLLFSGHHAGSREQSAGVVGAWLIAVRRAGLKDYGPKVGRRANDDNEKLRTEDISHILRQDFWVTDDPTELTRVNDVTHQNVDVWMPRVLKSLQFYNRLVSSFVPADVG
jgi:hypothetical protein